MSGVPKAEPFGHPSDRSERQPRPRSAERLLGWFEGRAVGPAPYLVAMGLVALMPWLGANRLWLELAELIMFFGMLTSGLNLTFGYVGELSFSQPALYALGAYLGGYLALHGMNNVLLTVVVGGVAAGLAGLVIGVPALRVGSWSMAMVSFFLILTIPNFVDLFQAETGGPSGLAGIPLPDLFGAQLTGGEYFVVCVAVAGLVVFCMRNLVRSRHGQAFLVLRESPVLARALGINVYWLKVRAYVLGSISAGMAGALFAYLYGYVNPDAFGFDTAIALIAASVIGGSRSVYGCFLGAAIVEIGPFESNSFHQYSLVVYGFLLVAAGVLIPSGLPSLAGRAWSRLRRRSRILVPSPTERSAPDGSATGSEGRRRAPASRGRMEPAAVMLVGEAGRKTVATAEAAFAQRGLSATAGDRGLSVMAVEKEFGGVKALGGVSLDARPGEITALIGANGSGKTTLLNVIAGIYPPSRGRVSLDGEELASHASHRTLSYGIARTFQTPIVPKGLTTLEVAMTARYRLEYVGLVVAMLRLPRYRHAAEGDRDAALRALARVGLGTSVDLPAASLPLGTRRLLEVARALVVQPRVLLLDEPASGLSEDDVERLGGVLRDFRDAGGVTILVEHNFGFVTSLADQVHVLELGRTLASGPPQTIRSHPEVIRSYLGGEVGVGAKDRAR